jgi:hypothetical protein
MSRRRIATIACSSALIAAFANVQQSAQAGETVPAYAIREAHVSGVVDAVPSLFMVLVRDDRGFLAAVELRNGTIITPVGLSLDRGQAVSIRGFERGEVFVANEINAVTAGVYRWPDWVATAYPQWTGPLYHGPVNATGAARRCPGTHELQ